MADFLNNNSNVPSPSNAEHSRKEREKTSVIWQSIQNFFNKRGFTDPEITVINDDSLESVSTDTNSNVDLLTVGNINFSTNLRDNEVSPEQQSFIAKQIRYKDYDQMIDMPELESGLTTYVDEATQSDINGHVVQIVSDNSRVKDMLERLFYVKLKIDSEIWPICFEMLWKGDAYREMILDKQTNKEIIKLKRIKPEFVERKEEDGKLMNFNVNGEEVQPFRIVHFRNKTIRFDSGGSSIFESGRATWRQLKLLEESVIVYRVTRSPERKVFYIDTGRLAPDKADAFIERMKARLSKKKMINVTTGRVDTTTNALSFNENFYIPRPEGRQGSSIETLPGIQGIGEIDDLAYFKDKLMALLKIPRDAVSYSSQSYQSGLSGKYLSEQDIRFQRIIGRVQENLIDGLKKIAIVYLALNGMSPDEAEQFEIKMTKSSSIEELRRIEVQMQVFGLIGTIKGLDMFPDVWILSNIMKMDNEEIAELVKLMKVQRAQANPEVLGAMGAGASGLFPGEAPPGLEAAPGQIPPAVDAALGGGGGMPVGGAGGEMGLGVGPEGGDMGSAPAGPPPAGAGTPTGPQTGAPGQVQAMINAMENDIKKSNDDETSNIDRVRQKAFEIRKNEIKKKLDALKSSITETFNGKTLNPTDELIDRLKSINEELDRLNAGSSAGSDDSSYSARRLREIKDAYKHIINPVNESVDYVKNAKINLSDYTEKVNDNIFKGELDYLISSLSATSTHNKNTSESTVMDILESMKSRRVKNGSDEGSILDSIDRFFSYRMFSQNKSASNNYIAELLLDGELKGKPQQIIAEYMAENSKGNKILNETKRNGKGK